MNKTKDISEERPNRLIALKIIIFLFFGALQCLYAYLPNHMEWLGFTRREIRMITLIASLVSIIGPLIVGFILDRVSVKSPSSYGKWLRILLFISFIAAGIFFGLLLFLSPAANINKKAPTLTFSCNDDGGNVYLKRGENEPCTSIAGDIGHIELTHCSYTCEVPEFQYFEEISAQKTPVSAKILDGTAGISTEDTQPEDYFDNTSEDKTDTAADPLPEPQPLIQSSLSSDPIGLPHVCFTNSTMTLCQVYNDNRSIPLLFEKVSGKENDETNKFGDSWCKNPLAGFTCNVPDKQVVWMKTVRRGQNITDCQPVIECLVHEPERRGSILEKMIFSAIDIEAPYDAYYTLRIIAEIFPIIIHMLLNISIIIATRETSVGRGNVGHQWAFYPIGVLVFASILGVINHAVDIKQFYIPMIVFPITMFVCAIVVLFSGKLPLTPNDWWWHTKCGLLAIPMSALKRYKWVIFAVALTAFILGGLWHVTEAFRHIFTIDIIEDVIINDDYLWRSKTFIYIIGSLIAIPIIWNGEKVVDLIGHSNIFIIALITFAMRFGGLYYESQSPLTSLYELLEPFSFYLAWFALLLFIRHLVPKRCLAIGQGILVILFFALGRCFFFYGTSVVSEPKVIEALNLNRTIAKENEIVDLQNIHSTSTIVAFFSALTYFVIYHLILVPRFHRVPVNHIATNDNSNVSPQRVFHDERSRKGYFRY